jgi:hypothetical protein
MKPTNLQLAAACPGPGGGKRREAARNLLAAILDCLPAIQPTTGRGVAYYLLGIGIIRDMHYGLDCVYGALRDARLHGLIPWDQIVDENRELEREATWDDLSDYLSYGPEWYRHDYWNDQPHRVEVWSEKGTVRGILQPVLEKYRVGFRVHSTTSWSALYDVASHMDDRPLRVLYVGDWDPTGVWLSEQDLPTRLTTLATAPGGVDDLDPDAIIIERVALTWGDCYGSRKLKLPPPLQPKKGDTRAPPFIKKYGPGCWELDAMDPNVLRNRIEREIKKLISDPQAWTAAEIQERQDRDRLEEIADAE